jgi:hypothetical protein
MKEIFIARKAFDACLMISADLVDVFNSTGGCAVEHTPGIDRSQQRRRGFAVRTNHDPVGMQKVLDRGALAQELGVRDHVEQPPGHAVALDRAANPLVGVDRDCTLLHNHLVAGQRAGNLAGHRFHVGEIGIARLGLRRAHRDKDRLAVAGGLVKVRREADLGVAVSLQQLRQVLLVDQGVARFQGCHLVLVVVDADNVMADLGKTHCRDQAYITRTYDGDLNRFAHECPGRPDRSSEALPSV